MSNIKMFKSSTHDIAEIGGHRVMLNSMINSACLPTNCKLVLFSRTQFRGVPVTLTTDSLDLADFDNKVESLIVIGNCKWTLYTEKYHRGVSQSFSRRRRGYKNAASIRKVLRKASSAKNDGCV